MIDKERRMHVNANVIEYKCPCCNAGLSFAGDQQQLTCVYCGTSFDIDAVRAFNQSAAAENTVDVQWEDNINGARKKLPVCAAIPARPAVVRFFLRKPQRLLSAPIVIIPPLCPARSPAALSRMR